MPTKAVVHEGNAGTALALHDKKSTKRMSEVLISSQSQALTYAGSTSHIEKQDQSSNEIKSRCRWTNPLLDMAYGSKIQLIMLGHWFRLESFLSFLMLVPDRRWINFTKSPER